MAIKDPLKQLAGLYQDNQTYRISACVDGLIQQKFSARGQYYLVPMNRVRLENGSKLHRIRLYTDRPGPWRYGQCWKFSARLRYPTGLQNPGGFDYAAWLFRQGIQALASLDEQQSLKPLNEPGGGLGALRQYIVQQIDAKQFTGKQYIKALLVADRQGFTDENWQVLKQSGLVHLFAISGLHIGMIVAVSYFAFRCMLPLLLVSFPALSIRSWALMLALLPASAYVALAGASPPALRAFLMALLVVVALQFRRFTRPGYLLLLVAMILLLFQPEKLFDASFQLSFAAVFAVLFNLRYTNGSKLYRLAKLQLDLLVIMAPLLVYWAEGISLSALVLNLVVIPLFSLLVMPCLLLSLSLMFVAPEFSLGCWQWLGEGLSLFFFVLQDAVFLQPGFIEFSHHPQVIIALVFAAVSYCLLHIICQHHRASLALPASLFISFLLLMPAFLVLFVVAWWLPTTRPAEGQFYLTVLDVGQGSAAVLETRRQTWLFDLGPAWASGSDAGERVILPFLRWRGINQVNAVMLSHYDDDHAGGLASIARKFSDFSLYAPKRESRYGLPVNVTAQPCYAGQQWLLDSVLIEVLSPPPGQPYSGNNSSCLLRVSNQFSSVLLPGDVEKRVEFELARQPYGERLQSEILVVPHHGSNSSSSWAFLSAVKPVTAVVSAGRHSPFRHPHPDVMARYPALGIRVLQTSVNGAILIDSEQQSVIPWKGHRQLF